MRMASIAEKGVAGDGRFFRHRARLRGVSRRARLPCLRGVPPVGVAAPLSNRFRWMSGTMPPSVKRWPRVIAREGRIDMVVNNAGIAIAGAVEDTSIEEAREQFDVNFFGVLRVCRAVLPGHARTAGGLHREYRVDRGAGGDSVSGVLQRVEVRTGRAQRIVAAGGEPVRRARGADRARRPSDGAHGQPAPDRGVAEQPRISRPVRSRGRERMAADEQSGPEPEAVARLLHRIVTNRARRDCDIRWDQLRSARPSG